MTRNPNNKPPGRIRSSIVARLNTRLFFRLLGIYFCMDLLLCLLFSGGLFFYAERQAADISLLVQERGVPTAEASAWMQAGDSIVTAGISEAQGIPLPGWLPSPAETAGGVRYFDPGDTELFSLVTFHTGGVTSYTLSLIHI